LAAFPGIGHQHVRELALQETIERWSICAWWEGYLPTRPLITPHKSLNACTITHPWKKTGNSNLEVVMLWTSYILGNRTTYAFACGNTTNEALNHAYNELRRNIEALIKSKKILESDQNISPVKTEENRLLFFSTEAGLSLFMKRLQASALLQAPLVSIPKLLVHQAIPGPWSQYTKVWRSLFEMPSQKHLECNDDYFLF
jgi:hypothetical protein